MVHLISKYYKAFVHVIVWSIVFALQLSYFSTVKGIDIAFERGIFIIILFLLVFYVNWFILIPNFYIKKQYSFFILSGLALIVISSFFRVLVEQYFNIVPGVVMRYQVLPSSPFRPFVFSFFLNIFIFITSFLIKIADYYTIQSQQREILVQQKTEAEIKLLKAQLNPHFLFNALNNIYALVLTRSDNAADSLMSLSQLLRYIIYDANADEVPLEKEVTYLKYYIDLESLRLNDKSNLKFDISLEPNSCKIMPLVFIPLVENSFKHSNIYQNGYVTIQLLLHGRQLLFTCENSYSTSQKNVDGVGGIGLANIRKRLDMFYPNRHDLRITNKNNIFSVTLKIDL